MSDNLSNIERARELAALSPQTKARLAKAERDAAPDPVSLVRAFKEIGRAIASKRDPVSDRDLQKLFLHAERLLSAGDHELANAVATDMLEAIHAAAHESGFDFSRVDPHLGPEARKYLVAWDDFNRMKTPGLTRD